MPFSTVTTTTTYPISSFKPAEINCYTSLSTQKQYQEESFFQDNYTSDICLYHSRNAMKTVCEQGVYRKAMLRYERS